MKNTVRKLIRFRLLWYLLIALFFMLFFRKIILSRVGAFGCFDDCFNISAGYFIGKGRRLFSEVFFNHQPSMAYVSFFIQQFFHPQSLYELIRVHRQSVWMMSTIIALLSVFRFGIGGLLFVLFYEFMAIYAFGDRFLGEAIVAPAIGYLFGISWLAVKRIRLTMFDGITSVLIVWFVIFTREPYIPIAVILFGVILTGFTDYRKKLAFGLIAALLCTLTILFLPIKDWWYQVVVINREHHTGGIFTFSYLVSMIVYPLVQIIGSGPWTILRLSVVIVIASFFLSLFLGSRNRKRLILFTVLSLTFTNTRPSPLSKMYYEAFHMLPWLAVLSVSASFAITELASKKRLLIVALTVLVFLSFQFVRKDSILNEHVDRQYEFVTGYNTYYVYGEAVKRISNPSDTLFVDGWDELIYWQAGRVNNYPMSWYTTLMPRIEIYQNQREKMFESTPPDYYYGQCSDAPSQSLKLPDRLKDEYINVLFNGRPTCLFVRNTKIPQISDKQKEDLKALELTIQ